MRSVKICLELTEDEASVPLEAMITERVRLRKFGDRRKAQGLPCGSKVLKAMKVLDHLVATLKGELK